MAERRDVEYLRGYKLILFRRVFSLSLSLFVSPLPLLSLSLSLSPSLSPAEQRIHALFSDDLIDRRDLLIARAHVSQEPFCRCPYLD